MNQIKLDIDAGHYRENSSVQFKLAEDVLALHNFTGNERVLDVGCGDGKLTYEIAKRALNGTVDGIDPSISMIELAQSSFYDRKITNLTFSINGAENIQNDSKYDLITSFCSLHWVRGQPLALRNMTASLSPKGKLLILTFPKESAYYRVLEELIYSEKWKKYSKTAACPHWLSISQYEEIISNLNLKKLHFDVTQGMAIYENQKQYIDYVKGWLPCLISIPSHLQDLFLSELAEVAYEKYRIEGSESFQIPFHKIVMYLENSIQKI